jgi:hypothetical protein
MMKCKMLKFLGLYLVSSKIQNLLSLLWALEALFGKKNLSLETKI